MCMPCYAARQKKYASKHPVEHIRAQQAKYRDKKKQWPLHLKVAERRRRYNNWLKKNYGITVEDCDNLKASQSGKCAICETSTPKGRGAFHVDHCHKTKRVRGLLCTRCNMMLGMAEDNASILLRAINYLNRHAQREDHKHEARKVEHGKQF